MCPSVHVSMSVHRFEHLSSLARYSRDALSCSSCGTSSKRFRRSAQSEFSICRSSSWIGWIGWMGGESMGVNRSARGHFGLIDAWILGWQCMLFCVVRFLFWCHVHVALALCAFCIGAARLVLALCTLGFGALRLVFWRCAPCVLALCAGAVRLVFWR